MNDFIEIYRLRETFICNTNCFNQSERCNPVTFNIIPNQIPIIATFYGTYCNRDCYKTKLKYSKCHNEPNSIVY